MLTFKNKLAKNKSHILRPTVVHFQLNDNELQKGKRIGVTISHNNHRLFVGNIPKNKDREELLEEFKKHARKCLEQRTKKITY